MRMYYACIIQRCKANLLNFCRSYDRGDFPMVLSHTSRGCKIVWKVGNCLILAAKCIQNSAPSHLFHHFQFPNGYLHILSRYRLRFFDQVGHQTIYQRQFGCGNLKMVLKGKIFAMWWPGFKDFIGFFEMAEHGASEAHKNEFLSYEVLKIQKANNIFL